MQSLPEVLYTSSGERYLHLPGLILTNDGSQTRYLLGDGLGSIRHAVDETAGLVAYHEFEPYGSPVEGGGEPYGFTGEWWEDEVGLLYLRARWYRPEVGIFLSRDLIESEPPYQYVRGNPVNRVDISGYNPQEAEVGTAYMYSCNCGWIDWHHAQPQPKIIRDVRSVQNQTVGFAPISIGFSEAQGPAVETSEGLGLPAPFGGSLIGEVRGGVTGEILVYTDLLSWRDQLEIALGIYISGQNQFESYQGGNFQGDWGTIRSLVDKSPKHSSFAEEDLVSNLIGFYRGVAVALGSPGSPTQEYYMRVCDVVGLGDPNFVSIQKRIFEEYDKPFIDNPIWGHPRLDGWDGSTDGKDCPTKACKQPRRFPSELKLFNPRPPLSGWFWNTANLYLTETKPIGSRQWFYQELNSLGLNQAPLNWNPIIRFDGTLRTA